MSNQPSHVPQPENSRYLKIPIPNDLRPWLMSLLMAVVSFYFGRYFPTVPFPIPIPPIVQPPVQPPVQPVPIPPAKPISADPIGAIVRIQTGNSGCTGVHLGDALKSGHSYWVTAAHCTGGMLSATTVITQKGERVSAYVVSRDVKADISILRSPAKSDYPFALLADYTPPVGTKVWQQGYGVKTKRVKMEGEVTISATGDGQTGFKLFVSSGDSGGPIYDGVTGRILAVV